MQTSICEIVRDAEQNYVQGSTLISEYVDFDMHKTLETIDAYLNSKHISGPQDSLGRDKPFFNIVTAAANIWYRATDLDRKDIKFTPTNSSSVALAFVANVMLQNWMNENRFGQFLNDWGRTLSRYGSAVVKFVEKDGKLIPSVVPWNRLIVDPISFDAIPRIEKFYKTPAQLRKMTGYDQDVVESLILAASTRKTLDGNQQDNQSNFIELYEVHGELPEFMLKDQEPPLDLKDVKYIQQMHVVSFVKGEGGKDEYEDYTLYKGREKKDPYMITHLIEEDGRTLAIGAVESLFDAQWMQNHTVKNMKDLLDLSSKLIFQTADGHYVGRNVITAMETGDILIHDDNKPLTQVNNNKADIVALQNFGGMWQNLGKEITSTPDAARGTTPPSGIAMGTVQLVTSQGLSLFEIMTESKGLSLEDMLVEHVIPNIKKRLKNKDEVVAILDDAGIQEIDAMYVPKKAIAKYNKEFVQSLIKGVVPSPYQADIAQAEVKQELGQAGNKRFFKPDELNEQQWDEVFSDFQWDAIRVEVVNENQEKQAVLAALDSAFKTVASLAGRPMTPDERLLFSSILIETGRISPLQLANTHAQPVPQPTAAPPGGTEALSALTSANGQPTS